MSGVRRFPPRFGIPFPPCGSDLMSLSLRGRLLSIGSALLVLAALLAVPAAHARPASSPADSSDTARSDDVAATDARPLGTVTVVTEQGLACAPRSTCQAIEVTCPGLRV